MPQITPTKDGSSALAQMSAHAHAPQTPLPPTPQTRRYIISVSTDKFCPARGQAKVEAKVEAKRAPASRDYPLGNAAS